MKKPLQNTENSRNRQYDSEGIYFRSLNSYILDEETVSSLSLNIRKNAKEIKKAIFSTPYAAEIILNSPDNYNIGQLSLAKARRYHGKLEEVLNNAREAYKSGDKKLLDSSRVQIYKILRRINLKTELAEKFLEELKELVENKKEIEEKTLETLAESQARVNKGSLCITEYHDSIQKLVEPNLAIVVSIANRYKGRGKTFLELISAGNEFLVRAAKGFNPKKSKFVTYAHHCITSGILNELSANSRDITELDIPANPNNPKGESLKEKIKDENTPTPFENNADNNLRVEVRTALHKALAELNPREIFVIINYFGLNDQEPRSLTEIAPHLKITRQGADLMVKRALKKLRPYVKHLEFEVA